LISLLPLTTSSQQVDPTRPFGALVSSPFGNGEKKNGLVLQSIIQTQQSKKALVNGKMLMIGDVYKGFELIAINSKGVVLHSSQGRMELSLFSGVIAKSK
jgi:hypothetical protein